LFHGLFHPCQYYTNPPAFAIFLDKSHGNSFGITTIDMIFHWFLPLLAGGQVSFAVFFTAFNDFCLQFKASSVMIISVVSRKTMEVQKNG